jgi:hypothetical protein
MMENIRSTEDRTMHGVGTQHGVGAQGAVTAAQLLEELERQITLKTAGRIRDLKVEATNQAIVLTGRTSTYYIKQLATQIALDGNTLLNLQNAIEVV